MKFIRHSNHNKVNKIDFTRQLGAAMVVSLIFLVLLTIIGVTGSQVTSLEEKMAGNFKDQQIALLAAEAALRDAEQDILDFRSLEGRTDFTVNCGAATAQIDDDGLCYGGPNGFAQNIWGNTAVVGDWSSSPSVAYGTFTGSRKIPDVAAQPRYIIEYLKNTINTDLYRITARAQGRNPGTVIFLQSTFKTL